MRTFASILGMILLIPLALVAVILAIITLIGLYIGVVLQLLGDSVWAIGGLLILVAIAVIVIKFLKR